MSAALKFEPANDEAIGIPEVCRRLGNMHRATFYRIPYFRTRRVRLSSGRVGVLVSDVNAYLRVQRGR